MPKHNNRASVGSRLARRATQASLKRSDLLGKILEGKFCRYGSDTL